MSSLDVASGGASQMRRKILMNPRSEWEGRASKNMEGGGEEGPEWGACVQLGPFTYHLHTRWRGDPEAQKFSEPANI